MFETFLLRTRYPWKIGVPSRKEKFLLNTDLYTYLRLVS